MTGGQVDRPEWAAGVADAFVDLSNALLALGFAVAGSEAMGGALGRAVEGAAAAVDEEEDPAGHGVDEDPRREPEDSDPWQCPAGLTDTECKAAHDHYPPPERRLEP